MGQLDGYYVMWGVNFAESQYFAGYTSAIEFAVDLPNVPIIVLQVETVDGVSRTTVMQSFSLYFR